MLRPAPHANASNACCARHLTLTPTHTKTAVPQVLLGGGEYDEAGGRTDVKPIVRGGVPDTPH